MIGREVALEALSILCNANVTSHQQTDLQGGISRAERYGGAAQQQVSIKNFIPTILAADETSLMSTSNLVHVRRNHIVDANEFFDPQFNRDFTSVKDIRPFSRGGEVYKRPCGWYRFGLKVLDKYDGNTWLGTKGRTTRSVPGEWPVSYHGTSMEGAEGIFKEHYKAGEHDAYGRGIYSSPDISIARRFAQTFTSNKTGKRYRVVLQNRINPEYREKHHNDEYWLVPIPKRTSKKKEQEIVNRAIRPYGLLLQEV